MIPYLIKMIEFLTKSLKNLLVQNKKQYNNVLSCVLFRAEGKLRESKKGFVKNAGNPYERPLPGARFLPRH